MGSLIIRATLAVVAGLALLASGLWHAATTWPAMFWLVMVPVFTYGAWSELRAWRIKQDALDARLRDEHVPSMSPIEYEQFTARQLERAGWKVLHCGKPGDQGCDVLAELRGFRAVVQVKKYNNRAGNDAVQQATGARGFYKAHVMVVVAPNGFTRGAQDLAAGCGVHLLHHNELHTLERAARIP